jgi:hypothetical protein
VPGRVPEAVLVGHERHEAPRIILLVRQCHEVVPVERGALGVVAGGREVQA